MSKTMHFWKYVFLFYPICCNGSFPFGITNEFGSDYHFTWAWIQACEGGTFECGGLADGGHQLASCAVPDSGFGVQTISRSSISTVIAIPTGSTSSEAATSTSPSANGDTTPTSPSSSSQTSPGSSNGSGGQSNTTKQSSSSPALSTGAIAGIAVGGAAVFIIIAILIFLLMRKHRTTHNTSGTVYAPAPQAPPGLSPTQQYAQPPMSTTPVGGYFSADTVKVPPGSPPPVYPQTFVSPDQGKLSPQANAAELSAPIQAPVQQSPVGSYRAPEQQGYAPYRGPEQGQQQQIYSPVSSMAPSPNPQGVHQVGGFTAELDGTQVWEK
jgi:hypothetical protein